MKIHEKNPGPPKNINQPCKTRKFCFANKKPIFVWWNFKIIFDLVHHSCQRRCGRRNSHQIYYLKSSFILRVLTKSQNFLFKNFDKSRESQKLLKLKGAKRPFKPNSIYSWQRLKNCLNFLFFRIIQKHFNRVHFSWKIFRIIRRKLEAWRTEKK